MFRKLKPFLKPDYLPFGLVFLLIVFLMIYFFGQCKEGFEGECTLTQLEKVQAAPNKTLVLLYADWCGHCKRLDPLWNEASKKADGRMLQRNVGKKEVDSKTAAENQEIMDKYNVDGFPTIIVLQNGKAVPYEGSRTVDAFLATLGSDKPSGPVKTTSDETC